MGVGYHKFQAGSPDGYLDFGVISPPARGLRDMFNTFVYSFYTLGWQQ